MAISVNTNVSALNAQNQLNKTSSAVQTSMERLSSGQRINSAKDDAAGMQISNRLMTQSRGLDVAVRNANDAISLSQTAEGAMQESTSILQRMRDLALQASNGSNGQGERDAIQEEIGALQDELNRIAETTSFGGQKLLNGTYGTQAFQIGASAGEATKIELSNVRADAAEMGGKAFVGTATANDWQVDSGANAMQLVVKGADGKSETLNISAKAGDDIEEVATYLNGQLSGKISASVGEDGKLQVVSAAGSSVAFSGTLAASLGLTSATGNAKTVQDIDVSSMGGAQMAVSLLDNAMGHIDSERASLGATQNRLNHTIANLENINTNVSASNSRIRDVDFAKETTNLTKSQILQQSSAAILAQAKQAPHMALSLLG